MLFNLAQSHREREFLRVALVKAAGMSATEARRHYGFEGMRQRSVNVDIYISETQKIREKVEDLAETQDKALLMTYGIVDPSDSSSGSEYELGIVGIGVDVTA